MPTESSFSRLLIRWYKKNARDLPWRHTSEPYRIWISEIMLQQTTVSAVIPYYLKWVKIFPRMESVAKAPLSKILKTWQGLGYYQRARNIHKAAQIICREHNGCLPSDPDVLRNLPGFGPYTTHAVLSIALGQRRPIIDANIRRVIMRLLALKGAADTKKDKAIYVFLDRVMPLRDIGIFNQALMELGALVCQPGYPRCSACPQKQFCAGLRKKVQNLIPFSRRKEIKKIEAAVAVIEKNGAYFMQKRPSRGLLAGMWEFPGGEIRRGESPRETLARELKEEAGVSLISAEPLVTVLHHYTKFRARLHAFKCSVRPFPRQDKAHQWILRETLGEFPAAAGTAKIIKRILSSISSC